MTGSVHQIENLNESSAVYLKLASALFYGFASFMITVVNKTILTSHHFPSFQVLGLGQMLATIVLLFGAKTTNLIKFPDFERATFRKIFPLPFIYLGNMAFGLGGTQFLSLPMFTALRRFSILFTMILELKILKIYPNKGVQISVYAMVFGALLAASSDLSFSYIGYSYVMLNNIFTAANGVYMKKKLDAKDLGKYGLMFYNALFMLGPSVVLAYCTGDIDKSLQYKHWNDMLFLIQFSMSCVMGFVLTYSTILCTHYNSALTTTIIGCLKNICVTYLGMIIGGDYVFSFVNFLGINVSVLGSLLYTYVTFRKKDNVIKQQSKVESV